jgi:heavy metal translocating P-type ATPase
MNADCLHCGLPCRKDREFCCYGCEFVHGLSADAVAEGESTRSKVAICAFFAMNLMAVSVLSYADEFQDAAAEPGMAALRTAFRWASAIFATPIVLILGLPMLKSAVDELRGGRATAALRLTRAAGSAFAFSWTSLLSGNGALYFDAACMTLVLVGTGRAIEASARARAMDSVRVVGAAGDATVLRRNADGEFEAVGLDLVRRGDRLRIPAGGSSPVDAVVAGGTAFVDSSIVTGESEPSAAAPGSRLTAGAIVLGGALDVDATTSADASTVAELETVVRRAQRQRAPIERAADRMAAVLVPAMLIVAVGAAIAGWRAGDAVGGMSAAIAVLIVACPCTFGIATPLAMAAALSRAAGAGIVVRSAAAVERLARVRAVVFDKTGTLTSLIPGVTTEGLTDEDLAAVLACESAVKHPLADAIRNGLDGRSLPSYRAVDARVEPEGGVSATVGGRRYVVGSAALAARFGIEPARSSRPGDVLVIRDGAAVGSIEVDEHLREGAAETVRRLHELGLHVELLTGDGGVRAGRIATALGLDHLSESTPFEKLARIETLEEEVGPTLMVGDGTNDGPALARASLGMTLAPTSELARSVAPVLVPRARLASVPQIIVLARRAMRTVYANLGWALAYNLVCVAFAATGRLTPLAAAVAMLVSSATVIVNSLSLLRVRKGEPQPGKVETETDSSSVPASVVAAVQPREGVA